MYPAARALTQEVREMTEEHVGPVDYLVVEFPTGNLTGEGFAALVDLVDRGIIRVLDLRVVKVEEDGTVSGAAIADFDNDGVLDLAVFEGVESGLLDEEDDQQTASLLQPGQAAALLVYENTWAGPFVTAMRNAGAELIASGRIPAEDIVAAVEALDAASA